MKDWLFKRTFPQKRECTLSYLKILTESRTSRVSMHGRQRSFYWKQAKPEIQFSFS